MRLLHFQAYSRLANKGASGCYGHAPGNKRIFTTRSENPAPSNDRLGETPMTESGDSAQRHHPQIAVLASPCANDYRIEAKAKISRCFPFPFPTVLLCHLFAGLWGRQAWWRKAVTLLRRRLSRLFVLTTSRRLRLAARRAIGLV